MAIPISRNDREDEALIESTSTSGQPAYVVINPDGSDVGGSDLSAALYVDDAAWTNDSSSHFLTGGIYQSSPQTITDGRTAPFNITVNGAVHVDHSTLSVLGGGTEAAALRVTLANNSTGLLTVDTAGTSGLEVIQDTAGDLNMTEASGSAIASSVAIMDDWDEANRAAVNIIPSQIGITAAAGAVAANTPRVTLGSDDPAVALLGTIDSDTNTIQTDTTSIDGKITACDTGAVVVASGAITETNSAAILADTAAIDTATAANVVNTANIEASLSGVAGALLPTAFDSYVHIAINVAAGATDTVLVSSAANKQIWVYGYEFSTDIAGTISIQDEDNTAVTGIMTFGIGGGAVVSPSGNLNMPIWKLATDKDLEVDTVTCTLDGWLVYAIVDVS